MISGSLRSLAVAASALAASVAAQAQCVTIDGTTPCGTDYEGYPVLKSQFASQSAFVTALKQQVIDLDSVAVSFINNLKCSTNVRPALDSMRFQTSIQCSSAVDDAIKAGCAVPSSRPSKGPLLCSTFCTQATTSLQAVLQNTTACPAASDSSARTSLVASYQAYCTSANALTSAGAQCTGGATGERDLCGWRDNKIAITQCASLTSDPCCVDLLRKAGFTAPTASSSGPPLLVIGLSVAGGVILIGILALAFFLIRRRSSPRRSSVYEQFGPSYNYEPKTKSPPTQLSTFNAGPSSSYSPGGGYSGGGYSGGAGGYSGGAGGAGGYSGGDGGYSGGAGGYSGGAGGYSGGAGGYSPPSPVQQQPTYPPLSILSSQQPQQQQQQQQQQSSRPYTPVNPQVSSQPQSSQQQQQSFAASAAFGAPGGASQSSQPAQPSSSPKAQQPAAIVTTAPVLSASQVQGSAVGSSSPTTTVLSLSNLPADVKLTRVLHPYEPTLPDELRLEVGAEIYMVRSFDDGWALGFDAVNSKQGAFPLVCVVEIEKGTATTEAAPAAAAAPIPATAPLGATARFVDDQNRDSVLSLSRRTSSQIITSTDRQAVSALVATALREKQQKERELKEKQQQQQAQQQAQQQPSVSQTSDSGQRQREREEEAARLRLEEQERQRRREERERDRLQREQERLRLEQERIEREQERVQRELQQQSQASSAVAATTATATAPTTVVAVPLATGDEPSTTTRSGSPRKKQPISRFLAELEQYDDMLDPESK
ncbi:hypothetical protein HK105_204367 [Polyrhizophydium stewartii]|uniref:SH3 domain-containing protein n=1 Tax=Polyrhizophydium stewartii TaxID=2732419 RepID=A0ABR4N915_9FUNG